MIILSLKDIRGRHIAFQTSHSLPVMKESIYTKPINIKICWLLNCRTWYLLWMDTTNLCELWKTGAVGISNKQSLIFFVFLLIRSATYNTVTGDCRISDMDRHTIAGTGEFVASPDDEFMENNCVDDPVRLCDFQLLENRIMKTVDSVYQVY